MKIKSGDKVLVIKGRDRGKTATVVAVNLKTNRIKVEGINTHKRHLKRAKRPGAAGGITEVTLAMSVSNVMLVDPSTSKPTRVGYKLMGEKKARIARVSKSIIEDVKR
jgi:large subunit ribosomal protein L24